MKAVCLLSKIKLPIPLLTLQRSSVSFSSSPAAAGENPRSQNSFFNEGEGSSAVYKHALKFQRPTTIKWKRRLWNTASFIGTVVQLLKALNFPVNGKLCAYTIISVSPSQQSRGSFRILLQMRDEMAEMCFKHLKENDFIYVSGRLVTSTTANENGNLRLVYKLIVQELNYVRRRCDSTCKKCEEPESDEGRSIDLEKYKNRLHLWQVFFSNPYEWWDNRKLKSHPGKLHPRSPDFRHKDTGEALWLSPNDPPWIKKQLQLLDSEKGHEVGQRARVSKWEYYM